jgi:acetyl esterase/lipase
MQQMVQPDPASQPLPAPQLRHPGTRSYCDIEFAAWVGYRPLLMDVHLPAAAGPAGLVVFVHGGGWMRGSRRRFLYDVSTFTEAGLALACIDYRLSAEAIFPAQLRDVYAALSWLAARGGELDLDTSSVLLWGESAGAHLAVLAGLGARDAAGETHAAATEPRPAVAGVVDWFGPADLPAMGGDPADPYLREARLIGGPVGERLAEARAASPVSHVGPDAPPFLIMHGTADSMVPVTQSQALAGALTRAGAEVKLITVPGAEHGWLGMDDTGPLVASVREFAEKRLGASRCRTVDRAIEEEGK